MTQHIIAPEAIKDLEEIIDYFALHNVAAGEKLLTRFEQKCRYLTRFPNLGRSYKQIRLYLRGLPLDGYIIFYRVIDQKLEIMRVIKGNRNFEALFDDQD